MREELFKDWLQVDRKQIATTIASRVSNCRRVERFEGDLDDHYDADGLKGLLDRLNPGEPRHRIPIDGDASDGTATLKSAVRLYRDFRNASSRVPRWTGQEEAMNDQSNGYMAEIRDSLQKIRGDITEIRSEIKDMRGDINVLSRRMDELPDRLERQIRIAVARDQARMATEYAERLEVE